MTTIPGVILLGVAAFAEQMDRSCPGSGWTFRATDKVLAELEGANMIRIDREECLIWICRAHLQESNKPSNPNQVKGWGQYWNLIADCQLKLLIHETLLEWLEAGFGEAFLAAFTERCQKPSPAWLHKSGSGSGSGSGTGEGTGGAGGALELPIDQTPVPKVAPERVLELWQSICAPAGLRGIRLLTDERRAKIRERAEAAPGRDVAWFEALFRKAAGARMLRGENSRKWVADIDFVLRGEKEVAGILEGKYDAPWSDTSKRTSSPAPPPPVRNTMNPDSARLAREARADVPTKAIPPPLEQMFAGAGGER